MDNSLENFLRKADLLALTNVRGYIRRGKNGQMVQVDAFHRKGAEGIVDELSQNVGNLNDQQLKMSIDFLRVNYNKLRADQQKAAQRLIDHLEKTKQSRAASSETLKYSINPLRNDERKLDWNSYRSRLRGILD